MNFNPVISVNPAYFIHAFRQSLLFNKLSSYATCHA